MKRSARGFTETAACNRRNDCAIAAVADVCLRLVESAAAAAGKAETLVDARARRRRRETSVGGGGSEIRSVCGGAMAIAAQIVVVRSPVEKKSARHSLLWPSPKPDCTSSLGVNAYFRCSSPFFPLM